LVRRLQVVAMTRSRATPGALLRLQQRYF